MAKASVLASVLSPDVVGPRSASLFFGRARIFTPQRNAIHHRRGSITANYPLLEKVHRQSFWCVGAKELGVERSCCATSSKPSRRRRRLYRRLVAVASCPRQLFCHIFSPPFLVCNYTLTPSYPPLPPPSSLNSCSRQLFSSVVLAGCSRQLLSCFASCSPVVLTISSFALASCSRSPVSFANCSRQLF